MSSTQCVYADKKVFFITGCSPGGLGYALAVVLAKNQENIVVSTLRTPAKIAADDVLRQSSLVDIRALDVVNEKDVAAVVKSVVMKYSKIDALVNNAGVLLVGPAAEITLKEAKELYDVNYFGVVSMVKEVFPYMAERHIGQIINVGSIAAWYTLPWNAHYAASKAALHAYTDALRAEVKPFGIDVLTVAPGMVTSKIQATFKQKVNFSSNTKYEASKSAIEDGLDVEWMHQTPTEKFAQEMARIVQQRHIPAEWHYGRLSTVVWILSWFPRWIIRWISGTILMNGRENISRSVQSILESRKQK